MKKVQQPRPRPPIRYAYCWGKGHTRWDVETGKWVPVTEVIRDKQGVVVEVR